MSVAPRSIATITGTRPYVCGQRSGSGSGEPCLTHCPHFEQEGERPTYPGNSVRLESRCRSEHLHDIREAAFDGDDNRYAALRAQQRLEPRKDTQHHVRGRAIFTPGGGRGRLRTSGSLRATSRVALGTQRGAILLRGNGLSMT